jgi:hypothetical protein
MPEARSQCSCPSLPCLGTPLRAAAGARGTHYNRFVCGCENWD